MSGIAKVSDKMKKKISFGDYVISSEPIVSPAPLEQAPKARKIYSLSKNDSQKLQEIFSKRLTTKPSSICEIMSEAIHHLHQKEITGF